ncbi:DUF547 domain-containing protein [Desulfohalovibrio reitneri]|uniref:DUF547 domain-containing protein n=1 Tax=Desulfohalovibrio reitneri TaxID=1307759 RepID=UPI0004A74C4D|nr:DUF547 domain-containing protein [Desulfohalovibrio reitneri]
MAEQTRAFSILVLTCCLLCLPLSAEGGVDNSLYADLLAEHVTADGLVDYQGLRADQAKLANYLDVLARTEPDVLPRLERKAFFINTYNAWTLKLILDHWPVDSIKDIGGWFGSPWDIEFIPLDENQVSLDHIEHDILRPEFNDPRIHFAVNCASMGCPKLMDEPFSAGRLDEQLDRRTWATINDPDYVRLEGGTLYVSEIFDWFQEDWGGEDEVALFVKRFADKGLASRIGAVGNDLELKYIDYDWSLNDARKGGTK